MITTIKKVENGYIIERGSVRIAASLEEVFDNLLLHFEGRAGSFSGDQYGTVVIVRCKCIPLRGTVGDATATAACSRCSPRLRKVS